MNQFRSLHKNIKIRLFVGLLFGIAQSTTMPFMAIYFAKSVGEAIAGLLLTVATLASLFAGFLGGYYCDRVGRRPIMIFGEAMFLVAYAVMAAANSPWWQSPWVTFVAFLITNICAGLYAPADDAMVLDVTTPESRTFVFGLFYWMHNLTLAIGSAVGAFLFESERLLLFALTGTAVLVSLVTTVYFIAETKPVADVSHMKTSQTKSSGSLVQVYLRVFRDTRFVMYLVGSILTATLEFQLNNYIGVRLAKRMVKETWFHFRHFVLQVDGLKMVGLLQTENTVVVVLFAALAIQFVTSRKRQGNILLIGLILNSAGYVLMLVFASPIPLLLAMLFATFGEIINTPIRQGYMGLLAPTHLRSTYVAMNGMSWVAARLIASLGVSLGAWVHNWVMAIASGIAAVIGILLIRIVSVGLERDGTGENIEASIVSEASNA